MTVVTVAHVLLNVYVVAHMRICPIRVYLYGLPIRVLLLLLLISKAHTVKNKEKLLLPRGVPSVGRI